MKEKIRTHQPLPPINVEGERGEAGGKSLYFSIIFVMQ